MSQVTQVYGGDEINAVVLEPGSAWTRVGWSAEDSPSVSYSTNYATRDGKNLFGDEQTYLPRPGTDIRNPMKNSIVEDWDTAKELWRSALSEMSPSRTAEYISESPLLITEPFWNTQDNQTKQMEFALEDLNAPAMYIAKSPVLSLFSAGRGTGLVIDVGEQTCSVTPVVDGFCLYKSARRGRRAGDYLSEKVNEKLFELNNQQEIVPQFQIKSKSKVELGAEPEFVLRDLPEGITDSFKKFQQRHIIDSFKEAIVQINQSPLGDEQKLDNIKYRVFEYPDGRSEQYGEVRYTLGEEIFKSNESPEIKDEKDPNTMDVESSDTEQNFPQKWSNLGISDMVIDCLKACDVDLRANMANNIVITGGVTLTQGFTERINQDLQREFPMMKIRLLASGNMVERKNGAWIGGSILASLGTFHQMWITRQEFEETGAEQLAQKRFR